MAENAIVPAEQKLNALTNPAYTGNTAGGGSKFPPVINILQSDKQYEAFGEQGNEITKKLYGKLFVRKQGGNAIEDLVDSVSGIVLKIEMGHEVFQDLGDGKKKIVDSFPFMVGKRDKETWSAEHPGLKYRNMVKVVLAPEMNPVEIDKKMESGENPFMLLSIKGSGGWEAWFDAQKAMNGLSMASKVYGHKRSNELFVSAFKFVISSKLDKSEDGQFTFYSPVIKVELNEPDVAYEYMKYGLEMKDVSLFYKVAEDISDRDMDLETIEAKPAEGVSIEEAFKGVAQDGEIVSKDINSEASKLIG